ncbi:hypothetical protein M9458_036735 [Cirrhinus mrigala]|uniref:Reverse transcriptase/retrotransposon-derived protein RNase H-like domain-containing protein n=1 Tax=Cirrhinus mrigala TaxID=683832 RepID=A0ABD0P6A5_CIRMR
MDQKKVDAVRHWSIPTSIKELQRFLGFANFYRHFVANFSTLAAPLIFLLQKAPKSLSWSPAASEAFHQLKLAFTTAPTLVHPNPNLPFIVEVDTSTTGVGAVLSQRQGVPPKLHPCAAFSKKLSLAEQNYDLAIENFEPSNWHWKNGVIGWSQPPIRSYHRPSQPRIPQRSQTPKPPR